MFEAANGGTLFLDEIGEMPVSAQAKLLRAVENQEVQRVGSTAMRKIDVRIVCATNRDLQKELEMKNFREDLFFRISMLEIRLPPLAERREDLPLLVRHFIDRFAGKVREDRLGHYPPRGSCYYAPSLDGQRQRTGERNRLRLHDDGLHPDRRL
jgi:transcriptional regulator with GAF, ATPase, and Fis domain